MPIVDSVKSTIHKESQKGWKPESIRLIMEGSVRLRTLKMKF